MFRDDEVSETPRSRVDPPSPLPSETTPYARKLWESHEDEKPCSVRRRRAVLGVSVPPWVPELNLTLQNVGSVARDHLASERTFLAYVRTSLAFASTGVALVQLFSIADITKQVGGGAVDTPAESIERFARPLGLMMIAFALVVAIIGAYRYFRIQNALPPGQFYAARLSIFLIAFVLGVFTVVIFTALIQGK